MAKVKTPKVEKPSKLTHVELHNAQNLVGSLTEMQMQLGRIETEKHVLLHRIENVQEMIGKLQEKFIKEYGTSDVNLKTGEINYKPISKDDNKVD